MSDSLMSLLEISKVCCSASEPLWSIFEFERLCFLLVVYSLAFSAVAEICDECDSMIVSSEDPKALREILAND